jgi:hypothetical protein
LCFWGSCNHSDQLANARAQLDLKIGASTRRLL